LAERRKQCSLPFSERDALKLRPMKRRRMPVSNNGNAGDEPKGIVSNTANNWGFANGLLRSPAGRRLLSKHAQAKKQRDSSRTSTATSIEAAPKDEKKEDTSSAVAAMETNEDETNPSSSNNIEIVENIPDPFDFFSRNSISSSNQKLASTKKVASPNPSAQSIESKEPNIFEDVDGLSALNSSDSKTLPVLDLGMNPQATRQILKKAVAIEAFSQGFDGVQSQAIDVLTDLAAEYICCFGRDLQASIGKLDLEQSLHEFELRKGHSGKGIEISRWEPRILLPTKQKYEQRQSYGFGIESVVRDKRGDQPPSPTTLAKTGGSGMRHSLLQKPSASDDGVANRPPYLIGFRTMGADSKLVGKATQHSAIKAVWETYGDIRESLIPRCMARMGISVATLSEHLHDERIRQAKSSTTSVPEVKSA